MTIHLTHRLLSEISLLGMAFDSFGGLYLAYDLLGGKSGPLRMVTRAAGYIALFLFGYILVLGLRYAIIAGFGMGVLLAAEYRLVDLHSVPGRSGRVAMLIFALLRGLVLGVAAMTFAGVEFGALFGLMAGVMLAVQPLVGHSPAQDYEMHVNPQPNFHKATATVLRAVAVTIAGLIAASFTLHGSHSLAIGLKLGLAAGTVSGLVGFFGPSLEWWLENVPEKRLGIVGLILIFIGMVLQSAQYFAIVLNINVS